MRTCKEEARWGWGCRVGVGVGGWGDVLGSLPEKAALLLCRGCWATWTGAIPALSLTYYWLCLFGQVT